VRPAAVRRPTWPAAQELRRPSGQDDPGPRVVPPGVRRGLAVFGLALAALLVLGVASPAAVQEVDGAVREALSGWPVVRRLATGLDDMARGLGYWSLWLPCVALLAWFARWRTLIVYLGTISVIAAMAQLAAGDHALVRAVRVGVTGSDRDVVLPAWPVVVLAAVATAGLFALLPSGRPRRWGWGALVLGVGMMATARVTLGLATASTTLASAVLGCSAVAVVFGALAPERRFPVVYRRQVGAHLRLDGARTERIAAAVRDQLGVELTSLHPYRLDGSAGSTPCCLGIAGGPPEVLFGKLYAVTHLRSDRWYKLARVLRYGRLEDEAPFSTVRRLAEHEDYMLRLLRDGGVRVPEPWGVVEVVPGREYLLVTEFVPDSVEILESAVGDEVIDDALRQIRQLWRAGAAHRDIKPSNVLVRGDRVYLIDVSFGELRPSRWRQAVDLADMMLTLALVAGAERVLERASVLFDRSELAEAFAATSSLTLPRQLRRRLDDDERDLLGRFRGLLPPHARIRVQRWSLRRVLLAVGTVGGVVLALVVVALNLWAGGLL
jgi:tRNA A-37 threonylcarbamoyl transferase component Bud32